MAGSPIIAVDAMSGDRGAKVAVKASLAALENNQALSIILVGDENELGALLLEDYPKSRLRVVHAEDVVLMDDKPALAYRRKQDSSMGKAIKLVRDGEADGCVSAGNTGALMMMGRAFLAMHPGIDRPAIIKLIPSLKGNCYVLDLGANVDSSAEHLFQFALMGSILAQCVGDLSEPRVALLNVGEEEVKGNEQVRLASRMLAECESLNYIGYVEGGDIFNDVADVIVCDGFVGNIALKTGEGVAQMLIDLMRSVFSKSWYAKIVGMLAMPMLQKIARRIDPEQFNGASLLGLNGVLIKSHGAASEKAFYRAIDLAVQEVKAQVPARINERLDEYLV